MIYYIIYGFLLLIGILDIKYDGKLNQISNNKILYFSIVILTLFRGLRWETGTDWEQFYDVFKSIDKDTALYFVRYGGEVLEPGYSLLNYITKTYISDSYTSFLLLSNFIILICFYKFSQKISERYQCLFFSLLITSSQFFPLRGNIAGAFLMLGTLCFYQKKYIKFIWYVFLGLSFHKSIIFLLPFILASRIYIKDLYIFIVYLSIPFLNISFLFSTINQIALIVTLLSGDYESAIEKYTNYEELDLSFSYFSYILGLGYLLFFIFIRKYSKNTPIKNIYNIYFNLFIFNIIGIKIAQIFNIFGIMRLFANIDYSFHILVCFSILLYTQNKLPIKKTKLVAYISFTLFFCLYFYRWSNSYPELLFPYYSIFDTNFHR